MSFQVRNARNAPKDPQTPRWQRDRATERAPCLRQGYLHRPSVGFSTVGALQSFCQVNGRELEYAAEYGEPGYSNEKGILLSNWNDIPKALQKRLEAQGYALEWEDEWYIDSDNSPSKAWRTSPDGHGWESRVRACDGYMLTPDSDAQEWIDDSMNEEGRALPSWFDESELTARGFGAMAGHDKEVGFHPGQDETPDKFMPALKAEGYDVLLQVSGRGQFDVSYRIWTRKEADRILLLSDARGQYIPRDFAREVIRENITGVSQEDLDTLALGPPGGCDSEEGASEHYWDIWTDVCDKARVRDEKKGITYTVYQDGDCWLIDEKAEFCEHDDTYYVHKE